jgi:hypothetical protein
MTWSLKLRNGDLALGAAQLGTVTGEEKLVQDLRAHILEHMGTDDMHPEFGSLIDGGTLPDGTVSPGIIGALNDDFASMEVASDIRRIVNDYQDRQLARAKDDRYTYGKVTINRGEVLLSLDDIEVTRSMDTLQVNLKITTARQSDVDVIFTLPI